MLGSSSRYALQWRSWVSFCQCPSKKGRISLFHVAFFLENFLGDYIKYLALLVLAFLQWVILFVEFVFMNLYHCIHRQPL